ncbi:MAG: helix-turn-helix domain-containing protein [Nannocystaceae bacterium]
MYARDGSSRGRLTTRSSRATLWSSSRSRRTPAEALALVGVSRNTLYRLAHEGRIPGAQKLGTIWRFHRATLLDFLAHPELHRQRRRR